MPDQFLLDQAPGLNEHTAIDRLVGDLHGVLTWKCQLEPPRDLFRRPLAHLFGRDDLLEHGMRGEPAGLGAASVRPGLRIGLSGAIGVGPTMAGDLTTDGRRPD